jgi:hypothetical protein
MNNENKLFAKVSLKNEQRMWVKHRARVLRCKIKNPVTGKRHLAVPMLLLKLKRPAGNWRTNKF